jgi:hypothetical protein
MSNIFTVRLDPEQRRKLKRRATALRMTESDFVRHLVNRELSSEPLEKRISNLKGCIAMDPADDDPITKELRRNNWRE